MPVWKIRNARLAKFISGITPKLAENRHPTSTEPLAGCRKNESPGQVSSVKLGFGGLKRNRFELFKAQWKILSFVFLFFASQLFHISQYTGCASILFYLIDRKFRVLRHRKSQDRVLTFRAFNPANSCAKR